MLFGNNIARRVSRVIKARVRAAQKEHDDFCRVADQDCEDQKKKLELDRDLKKEKKAEDLVTSIIGLGK